MLSDDERDILAFIARDGDLAAICAQVLASKHANTSSSEAIQRSGKLHVKHVFRDNACQTCRGDSLAPQRESASTSGDEPLTLDQLLDQE